MQDSLTAGLGLSGSALAGRSKARRRPLQSALPGRGLSALGSRSEPVRIGLCVPMEGSAGIWGPSCLASAQLAQEELNQGNGIAGRICELVTVNAADESADLEQTLRDIVDGGEVDALVGMHISSVRQRIASAIGGRIPYVYTCLYEGGETTPGLFAIGETSEHQLLPSIRWLSEHARRTRWALVGNDYVWPRVSHAIARRAIASCGGEVVAESYLPFGLTDYSAVFDQLRRSRADAVLISIVGQDAVHFNRAFAQEGLAKNLLRLSCAIEENQLLAIGADNTENLHVALGYFAALESDANGAFKERYHSRFGARAPTLNSIGQSLYEGLQFLAALCDPGRAAGERMGAGPLAYPSARGAMQGGNGLNLAPMYLARTEGHLFRVVRQF